MLKYSIMKFLVFHETTQIMADLMMEESNDSLMSMFKVKTIKLLVISAICLFEKVIPAP